MKRMIDRVRSGMEAILVDLIELAERLYTRSRERRGQIIYNFIDHAQIWKYSKILKAQQIVFLQYYYTPQIECSHTPWCATV